MGDTAKKVFYTTPIYYVNDKPHIGHAYTTTIADVLAIYSRLIGLDVFFLTGTDEHGQKIEQSASKHGVSPKAYADKVSKQFADLWEAFEMTHDHFVRTTDEEHKQGVQHAFAYMFEKGDIYKDSYEGNYCVGCETYFTNTQLIEQELCPDCGRETQILNEESYFFRLSKYQDALLEWYDSHEDCILPVSKKNEVINFVKEGLRDLSITRTSFDWGIKLPTNIDDPKHVLYVWMDALLNYITMLGYGNDKHDKMDFWPAKVQIVGKDILRFHAIYWPAFLMSLDLPLPKHVAAHGWWTRNGEKMSKSKGNVIDPLEVAKAYGLEEFRYFMLREVPFGQDGDFSQKALVDRVNANLGNDLGNLASRTIGMAKKYFDLDLQNGAIDRYFGDEVKKINAMLEPLEKHLYVLQMHRFLEDLFLPVGFANQLIAQKEPWALMKQGGEDEVKALLVLLCNVLSKVGILLYAVMPKKMTALMEALGGVIDTKAYDFFVKKAQWQDTFVLHPLEPLFPRIDEMRLPEPSCVVAVSEDEIPTISFDAFSKVNIRVGVITKALAIDKSDRLLKLRVEIGGKERQVISGIKKHYDPKDLIGKQVCVVANLKPAKIMGMLSEGMILTAEDDNGLGLISPDGGISSGAIVK